MVPSDEKISAVLVYNKLGVLNTKLKPIFKSSFKYFKCLAFLSIDSSGISVNKTATKVPKKLTPLIIKAYPGLKAEIISPPIEGLLIFPCYKFLNPKNLHNASHPL